MPLKINSTNGSVTLTPVDGVGNVDITIPRSSFIGQDHGGDFIADRYNERYASVSSVANVTTIDCSSANTFSTTLIENTTCVFSNPPSSGVSYIFSLEVIQDVSASGFTVTWPPSVIWPLGAPIILTQSASAIDLVVFYTRDGGTTWYGLTVGREMS